MTNEQLQQIIHRTYEGDVDYPSFGDEDFSLRTGLMNEGIHRWENDEDGTLWNELFVSLSDAASGDSTIAADTTAYDAPDDFQFPAGYLRIGSTFFRYLKPEQVQLQADGAKYYYVTGNESIGYTVHINGLSEDHTGETFDYDYYKTASEISAADDVPEMSNSLYLAHYCLATLFDLDGDQYRASKHFQIAENLYRGMKLKNIQAAWFQDSSFGSDDVTPGFGVSTTAREF